MIHGTGENVNPFLRFALSYAKRGFAVFPLRPRDKRPATTNGVKDATTDVQQITNWWTTNPDYNIAIALGAPSQGLVVVDYDRGSRAWLDMPHTPMVQTGNGQHLYYYLRDGTVSTYNHADGEVRSTGSYVVAPPSIHPSGRQYNWTETPNILTVISVDDLPPRVGRAVEPLPVNFVQDYDEDRIDDAIRLLPIRLYYYLTRDRRGDRSGKEYALVHELVKAGLNDMEILQVFLRYLGENSHFAEHKRPRDYIAMTIGKARAENHEGKHTPSDRNVTDRKGAMGDVANTDIDESDPVINGESRDSNQDTEPLQTRNNRELSRSTGGSDSTDASMVRTAHPTNSDGGVLQRTEPDTNHTPNSVGGRTDVHGKSTNRKSNAQWEIRTLKDAYQERPPIEYVVSGLFSRGSLNIVYGAPGGLKSMLVADLCASVVGGHPWLVDPTTGRGWHTNQTGVLWVDYDNGTRRSDERFESIGKFHHLREDAPLHYASMQMPWLNAQDERTMHGLAGLIDHLKSGIVVIDNLGLVSGDADENSAEMISVMGAFRLIAEQTNTCVILIHHERKGNGAGGRRGERMRGFSGIEGAIDIGLLVEREDGGDLVTNYATKVRGAPIRPFGAQFSFTHKAGTQELSTAGFYGFGLEDKNSDYAVEKALLGVLHTGGYNQTDLIAGAQKELENVGRNRILAKLKLLVSDGRVYETVSGARNAKHYAIAEE